MPVILGNKTRPSAVAEPKKKPTPKPIEEPDEPTIDPEDPEDDLDVDDPDDAGDGGDDADGDAGGGDEFDEGGEGGHDDPADLAPRSTVFTVNNQAMRQKAEELRRKRGGRWKPPQGLSFVRVLPPWNPTKGMWYKETSQHFFNDLGLPEGAPAAIECRRMFGKMCPICKLADETNSDRLKANDRAMMNILVAKEDGTPIEGVQQWECSMSQLQDLLEDSSEDLPDENFTHPVKGRFVKVLRKGENKATRYKIKISRNQTKLRDYQTHLASRKDLDKLNKEPEKEEYLRVYKLLKTAVVRKNMLADDNEN